MTGTTKVRSWSHGHAVLVGVAALATSAASLRCASSSSPTTSFGGYDAAPASGTDASVNPGHPTGFDAGAGDSSAPTSEDSGGGSGATALPFFLSDQFIPSGFMNDPTGITVSTGANGTASCPTRAPGAGGDCYVTTWASTGATWAGVYWQYPSNNWGTEPGLVVAPGATQVSFYAQGAVGGEQLTFKVGGINDPLNASTGNYGDSFAISSPLITLTTTWTQYTISLQGADYAQGVLGGFVWVAAGVDGGNQNIKFYLDDLTWE